jgi:hypothetical protein
MPHPKPLKEHACYICASPSLSLNLSRLLAHEEEKGLVPELPSSRKPTNHVADPKLGTGSQR